MSHWNWTAAPDADQGNSLPNTQTKMELRIVNAE
jgi:beta-glucosidase